MGIYSPHALAQDVLRGIDRKKAMVVAPRTGRVLWRIFRISPAAFSAVMGFGARREMKKRLAAG
jgi:hypothetical protein